MKSGVLGPLLFFLACLAMPAGVINSGTLRADIYYGGCSEAWPNYSYNMALRLDASEGSNPINGKLCGLVLMMASQDYLSIGADIPVGWSSNVGTVSAYGKTAATGDFNTVDFLHAQLIADTVHYTGGNIALDFPFTMNLEFGRMFGPEPHWSYQFTGSGTATLIGHEVCTQSIPGGPQNCTQMAIDSLVYRFESVPEPGTFLVTGLAIVAIAASRFRNSRYLRR